MSTAVRRITSMPHAATKACIDWNFSGPSNSEKEDDYFRVLQVGRKATTKEVQAAFKQAARLCHPDLHHSDPTAEQRFRKCLLAYQVLSDPEARRCHELALDCSASPGLRRAASTMAFRSRAAAAYDISFWEALSPSHWRAIASAEAALAPPVSASLPTKAASHLARELEASLHQVHFGPDISDLAADHLPPAFEAEHRSHPLATDVLQLVSGQTVLGGVRCRHPAALPAAQARCGAGDPAKVAEGRVGRSCDSGGAAGEAGVDPASGGTGEEMSREDGREAGASAGARPHWTAWGRAQLRALEAMWTQADADGGVGGPGTDVTTRMPAPQELVFSMSGEDQVVGVVQGSGGLAGGWVELVGAQTRQVQAFILGDMVADAQGRHTHTILCHTTPGVLHTAVFSMAARKVVFRATRTWLPDPRYWFVPPRTQDYDTGGWYVEWVGHEQARRAGWLHPGAACIILAMQALNVERGQGPWWLRSSRRQQLTAV